MHELPAIAGKLAAVISLSAFAPYILSILQKKTKPNRASWIIWAVVSSIIALSYREAGAGFAFLTPAGYVMGALIILVLSIRNGVGGWTPFDRKCLLGAAVSLVLWRFLHSPMSALLINLFINFVGTLPTMKKSWHQPESESKIAWSLFSLGTIVNLFAIQKWTLAMAVYPVSMFFIVGTVTVFVLWTKRPGAGAADADRKKSPPGTVMNTRAGTVCGSGIKTPEEPGRRGRVSPTKNHIPARGPKAADWVKKGVISYKTGDYQNAIHAFSMAIELDATLPAAYFNRAVACYKLGDKKRAIQNLDAAAKRGHNKARNLLKKLQGQSKIFRMFR